MSGIISKIKNSGLVVSMHAAADIENNPITEYFDVMAEFTTAGPELLWKVHNAYRKSDRKECSVFILDKRVVDKLYLKSKRKDSLLDRIKHCILQLERLRHPKMLQIIHTLEEGNNTIAFASEPVLSCLHNILLWHESRPVPEGAVPRIYPHPRTLGAHSPPPPHAGSQPPPHAKEYYFHDMELRYGILQITEALQFMHYTSHQIHRNVCPQVIVVTKRGTWKLFGMEYSEPVNGYDPTITINVPPWSVKIAKMCQPNLDFLAPEVQTRGECSVVSDLFSLGLVICALYNHGQPLIQASNNTTLYTKQMLTLEQNIKIIVPRMPQALQELVQRMLSWDPTPRPTSQLLSLIKCQVEPAIHAMQFLDVVTMKDSIQRSDFYRNTLVEVLPYIPKKLHWQLVWPALELEAHTGEVLPASLVPILWLTKQSTVDEFNNIILPTIKTIINSPRSVKAWIMLLENLHIVLRKCSKDIMNSDILPLLYRSLKKSEHSKSTNQASFITECDLQTASLLSLQNISEFLDDKSLHTIVLPKLKILLDIHPCDVKIISLILGFYEKVLGRLERPQVLEHVIPTLLSIRLTNPDIITRVVKIYKSMLLEPKFGLTTTLMATKMIPSLAPQTINPGLNADQFTNLMEILYDMLENIDSSQRNKLRLELSLTSPERHRLRHQMSNDNVPAPPFNIPNLRVDQRKTSSAENMARNPSVGSVSATSALGGFKSTGIGQWFFGSANTTTPDSNFLRVSNVFPNRRLSDNTLLAPKIHIAPSCASSPGGTPGGAAGLPSRRHSSIGPQERRGSAANLSPPPGYRVPRGRGGSGSSLSVPSTSHYAGGPAAPNTSTSVPFLLTSSMQSMKSRRPSACSQGSGLLQQLSSGMHQLFSGRT